MPPRRRKKAATPTKKSKRPKPKAKKNTISTATLARLKNSEKQLQIVMNAAHMGTWEWNVVTNELYWSGEVFRIFDVQKDFDKSYEVFITRVHPEDRERVTLTIQDALRGKSDYFAEYRIIRNDKSIRWLEVRATIKRDRKGSPVKFAGTIQDVTERKVIEHDREDWKKRHELISTSAGLVIYDYDIPSGNISWSGNSDTVLGYTPAELGDIDQWVQLIHPDDRDEAFRLLEKAQEENKPYDVYYRFSMKGGRYCNMHDRGIFVLNEEGKAARMLGMMNDVTERVKAQESLIESEARFRTLQEASFGGIGLHEKGVILDCNQGLCDLTGYSYDELIGSNGLELIVPESRNFVLEKIVSGYDKTYDTEGLRKDGSRYFLEIRGKNMPYLGRVIRVTEFRDITDRKVAEEKVIEQNTKLLSVAEELRRKNHQLQEFTQIVSHNLRSPVGNILTLLSFYDNAVSDEEKTEYIALLREAGTTTLTMLNELNEVLKIKQDKNIPKQELSFEKCLGHVISMLNARITETNALVTSNFSKAQAIQYPTIYLESIMLNLLDNALKYHSPERQPNITFETSVNEQNQLILSVSDNGLGINLERYGHQIFKLRKTFHHHPESRGIGLFMIKNQIEAMGGEISISSLEGHGTTFFINFNKHHTDG